MFNSNEIPAQVSCFENNCLLWVTHAEVACKILHDLARALAGKKRNILHLARSCIVLQDPKQGSYSDSCKIKFSMQESCKLTRCEESCKLNACNMLYLTRLLLAPCKIHSTISQNVKHLEKLKRQLRRIAVIKEAIEGDFCLSPLCS